MPTWKTNYNHILAHDQKGVTCTYGILVYIKKTSRALR